MVKNFIWDLSGKLSGYVISLVTSIIMARLLLPADFGILSLAQIFSLVISMVMEMGLSSAIIQRKEVKEDEINVVFSYNLLIVGLLTLVLWTVAPLIARFYHTPQLLVAVRVICVQLLFSGLSVIPMAMLYRQMRYREIMVSSTISGVIGAVVAIVMALRGFGYVALAVQGSVSAVATFLIYTRLSRHRTSLNFRFSEGRDMFSFSYKIFLSTILNQVFQKIDVLIFGRIYPIASLGYYNRAASLDNITRSFSSSSILNVLLPQISKMQSDKESIRQLYLKVLHLLCFLFFLGASLIYLNSSLIIRVLFGPRWEPSSVLLQMMLVATFAYPVSSLMLSVIEGMGFAGLFLRLELVKKLVALPFLFLPFFLPMDKYLLALGVLAYAGVIVNAVGVQKAAGVSWRESVTAVMLYNMIAVAATAIPAFALRDLGWNQWISMVVGSLMAALIYISVTRVLHLEGFAMAQQRLKAAFIKN